MNKIKFYSDLIIDVNETINSEIEKYDWNIQNGIRDMKRDINMKLVEFHKSYEDTREVFYFILFNYLIVIIIILLCYIILDILYR
jgi:hypothetical protein